MAGSASIPATGQLDRLVSWKRADASSGIGTDRGGGGTFCYAPSPAAQSVSGKSAKSAISFTSFSSTAPAVEIHCQAFNIASSLQQQQQRRHFDPHCCGGFSVRSGDGCSSRSGSRSADCLGPQSLAVHCSGSKPQSLAVHCSGSKPQSLAVYNSSSNLRGGALVEESPGGGAEPYEVGGGGGGVSFSCDGNALNAFRELSVAAKMGAEQGMGGQQRESSSESIDMMIVSPDGSSSSCDSSRDGSSDSGEDEGQEQFLAQQQRLTGNSGPQRWDVVGLGQAMVDFSGIVDDSFLDELGFVKGTRKVVNDEERRDILQALGGWDFKLTAGGSLSNTLVALARLGYGHNGDTPLRVAMTGSVGRDVLGDFYRTKLRKAGVHFLADPISDAITGSVIVCTTPDAQRTMLSYQGMSSTVNLDDALERQISTSRIFVVEGYLWELPETVDTIAEACKLAKSNGALVALTASDRTCVMRHRKKMWDVMAESADILFTNFDEARALLGAVENFDMTPGDAAAILSLQCPLVSVTDGAQGSYIGIKGEVTYVNPASCLPVDTCGAGDAYAAGILYGLLRGDADLKSIGRLAAKVASVVVGQQGPRLKEQDARLLSTAMPSISCLLEGLNLDVRKSEQSVNA